MITGWGLTRIIGTGVIFILGSYPVYSGPVGMFSAQIVLAILQTVLLFLLVTTAYEWMNRPHS